MKVKTATAFCYYIFWNYSLFK